MIFCVSLFKTQTTARARAAAAIIGREVPDRFFQRRFRAGIEPDMPEWLVETAVAWFIRAILRSASPCISMPIHFKILL